MLCKRRSSSSRSCCNAAWLSPFRFCPVRMNRANQVRIAWSFPSNKPDTNATMSPCSSAPSVRPVWLSDSAMARAGIRQYSTHLLRTDKACDGFILQSEVRATTRTRLPQLFSSCRSPREIRLEQTEKNDFDKRFGRIRRPLPSWKLSGKLATTRQIIAGPLLTCRSVSVMFWMFSSVGSSARAMQMTSQISSM